MDKKELRPFLASWEMRADSHDTMLSVNINPYWRVSGAEESGADGYVAAVMAESEKDAENRILSGITGGPHTVSGLKCVEKPLGWSPFFNRVRYPWMIWERTVKHEHFQHILKKALSIHTDIDDGLCSHVALPENIREQAIIARNALECIGAWAFSESHKDSETNRIAAKVAGEWANDKTQREDVSIGAEKKLGKSFHCNFTVEKPEPWLLGHWLFGR